jgi:hydrogenase maturation factor
MHDPTEGGLATALWELSEACGHGLEIDLEQVPIPPLAARVCEALAIDPLAAISSGALLLTAAPDDACQIIQALVEAGIPCADIGRVTAAPVQVVTLPHGEPLRRPDRDEIARLLEHSSG